MWIHEEIPIIERERGRVRASGRKAIPRVQKEQVHARDARKPQTKQNKNKYVSPAYVVSLLEQLDREGMGYEVICVSHRTAAVRW